MADNLHTLLVDDVVFIQQIVSNMLIKLGHTCDIAENGEQALSLMTAKSYDVVLMDLQMPVMDGLTASREAKAKGIKTPIIGISGNTTPQDRQACVDAKMDGFISKPPTLQTLKDEIHRVLG